MIDRATKDWTERSRANFRRRVADAVAAKWTRAVIDWIDSNITVKELTEFFQENEL